MKHIVVSSNEHGSAVPDFLQFNDIKYQSSDLWNNNLNLFDFELLGTDSQGIIVILDYAKFIPILDSVYSYNTLILFLKQKSNHLMIWNDMDSGVMCDRLKTTLLNIDAILDAKNITLIVDAKLELKFNNINLLEMPFTFFTKHARKSITSNRQYTAKTNFILTIRRKSIHRDLLWEKLDNKNLLSQGFSIYHGYTDKEQPWLGEKSSQHDWHDGHPSADLYNNAFFEIVPETAYKDILFITEKTIKPITHKLPFLIVSTTGYLEYLRSHGFKTFDGIIDESYDLEPNLEKRVQMVVEQVSAIINNGSEKFYNDTKHITEHNYNILSQITGAHTDTLDNFIYNTLSNIGVDFST